MQKLETLVILTPGFPVDGGDTTCITPQQIFVKALKQNNPGLNVIIITFDYPPVRLNYQWHGMPVISTGGKNRGGLFRLWNWVRVWQTLRKLNKQYLLIGLLSFWFDECAFIGHHFSKRYSTKHHCWILGQDAKPRNRYFKRIKPEGGSLIALSDFIRKEVYKNHGVMPQHTITTGIDVTLFGITNGIRDIDILGAGSLITLKQYDVFINAVKIVASYIPHIKAVICGKGPEQKKLIELIKANNLENNISLLSEVPHVEVLALMQRSKVFLHTSKYEGFGAVLLEALYAGAQVVSFVKPMDMAMDHHHVVSNLDELDGKLFELLRDKNPDNDPVLVYPIASVVADMMYLFEQGSSNPFHTAGYGLEGQV